MRDRARRERAAAGRRAALDQQARETRIRQLWEQVPDAGCKGLCADSCGPIGMSDTERHMIRRRYGVEIKDGQTKPRTLDCPALTDGRCTVYELRPLVCLLPSSWVFTRSGPKRAADVIAGDLVYSHDGNLHLVEGTMSRLHSGEIINVRHSGTHVPCWVTADHQFLTTRQRDKRSQPKPGWRAASTLITKRKGAEGDYLTFPRVFHGPGGLDVLRPEEFVHGRAENGRLHPWTQGGSPVREIVHSLPLSIPVGDELLFMLGLFLAEGSASRLGAMLTMHADEEPILKRVAAYLESIGVTTIRVYVKRNTSVLSASSALLGRLLKELCGAGAAGKRIHPRLFEQLSFAQLWQVYEGWHVGDGRKSVREMEMHTTTVSEELAVQMAMIALGNGLFPRTYLSTRPDRGTTNYDVHLYPSNWRQAKPGFGTKNMVDDVFTYTPTAPFDNDRFRAYGIGRKNYDGPVIDIQVQGAESFVTSSGIAHNCRVWASCEALPCPHGCAPANGRLSDPDTAELMNAALDVGGRGVPAGVLAKALEDPQLAALFSAAVRGHRDVYPALAARLKEIT